MKRSAAFVMTVLLLVLVGGTVAHAAVKVEVDNNWITGVAVDQNDASRVVATTAYLTDPAGATYISDDYGASFSPSANPAAAPWGGSRLAAAGSRMYGAEMYRIWRTSDGGDNWTQVHTGSSWLFGDVWASSANSDVALAAAVVGGWPGQVRCFRTSNGGTTWNSSVVLANGWDKPSIDSLPSSPDVVIGMQDGGTTDGGVYHSPNSGLTWTRRGLAGLDVNDVALDPTRPGIAYAASNSRLMEVKTDGSGSTTILDAGSARMNRVAVTPSGIIVAGGWKIPSGEGFLYVSKNSGTSFDQVMTPGESDVQSIAFDHTETAAYVGTGEGVYRHVLGVGARRIAGATRYETAIDVSKELFPATKSADSVIICTAFNYPDAISAAPFAGQANGPILLSSATSGLSATTLAEVERVLKTGGTAYLIGGSDVVPDSVMTTLAGKGYSVERLEGPTRYETAVKVAEEISNPTSLFIAVGTNFPDALCASPPAAGLNAPVLFSQGSALKPAVAQYIDDNPSILKVYIVGDVSVVPASVEAELNAKVGNVERLGGATRYDTCLEITERFYPGDPTAMGLASGAAFPDALTGSVLCAQKNAPLMITRPSVFSPQVDTYIGSRSPDEAFIFGGTGAVSHMVGMEFEQGL